MTYNAQMDNVLKLQQKEVRSKASNGEDPASIFSGVSVAVCPITTIAPVSSISAFLC